MNVHYALKVESIREDSDDELEEALLYVTCNEEALPVPGIIITGVGGNLNTPEELFPLIITNEGKGDYGSSFNWVKRPKFDRYFYTDIRHVRIEVGAEFSVRFTESISQDLPVTSDDTNTLDITRFKIIERIVLAGVDKSKLAQDVLLGRVLIDRA
ncbi:hypothetical protein YH63_005335 [Afipia massiliensis]|uniref:Uncharacterized protein n=1 Tax=Afipia massiliensis TaxID=211460 RepID=A0A4U6BKX9_9BRAD|nr:hypothetical protein [Afipia massiliensis]TKT70879.1 hypothetical protein YH63_005335 [Afipia massiliensis]